MESKIVREYINEKFREVSDPVKDLGIGIKFIFEKWCEEIGIDPYENLNVALYHCVRRKKYKFVKYLLEYLNVDPDTPEYIWVSEEYYLQGACLRRALQNNDIKMIEILLNAGADPTLVNTQYYIFSYDKKIKKSTKNFFKTKTKLYNIKERSKINEKFTQESDPVRDLNIGYAEKIRNIFNKIDRHPQVIIGGEKIILSKDGAKIYFKCLTHSDHQIPYVIDNLNKMLIEIDLAEFLIFPPKVKKNVYFHTESTLFIYKVKPKYIDLFRKIENKKIFDIKDRYKQIMKNYKNK